VRETERASKSERERETERASKSERERARKSEREREREPKRVRVRDMGIIIWLLSSCAGFAAEFFISQTKNLFRERPPPQKVLAGGTKLFLCH
jgi:hypothetical protein